MKFMVSWTLSPGAAQEAAEKFLAGEGAPPEGVALLGRWHRVDGDGGFSLVETDRPEQLYRGAVQWADLLDIETYPVIEDEQAGPVLAETFGSQAWSR